MWRFAWVLVACGDPSVVAPAHHQPPTPALVPLPPPPVPSAHAKMHTSWGAVRTDDRCWYFSGPAGRDTHLAGEVMFDRDGANVTMTFGGVTFTGTYRDNVLDLERNASYVFDGRWMTRETIKGDYLAGKVVARYHYEECLVGTACDDHCAIDATLLFAI